MPAKKSDAPTIPEMMERAGGVPPMLVAIAGEVARSMARWKLSALTGSPGDPDSHWSGRTSNVYVLASAETVGIATAASGSS